MYRFSAFISAEALCNGYAFFLPLLFFNQLLLCNGRIDLNQYVCYQIENPAILLIHLCQGGRDLKDTKLDSMLSEPLHFILDDHSCSSQSIQLFHDKINFIGMLFLPVYITEITQNNLQCVILWAVCSFRLSRDLIHKEILLWHIRHVFMDGINLTLKVLVCG